jgi:hypothetical protein
MYIRKDLGDIVAFAKVEVSDFVCWNNVKLLLWVLFSFEVMALAWETPAKFLVVAFFLTWAIWRINKI